MESTLNHATKAYVRGLPRLGLQKMYLIYLYQSTGSTSPQHQVDFSGQCWAAQAVLFLSAMAYTIYDIVERIQLYVLLILARFELESIAPHTLVHRKTSAWPCDVPSKAVRPTPLGSTSLATLSYNWIKWNNWAVLVHRRKLIQNTFNFIKNEVTQ
jgi:hypothetical protein